MTSMFYEVLDDMGHPTAWWLGKVQSRQGDFDSLSLKRGQPLDNPGTLVVSVEKPGEPMAFSFASFFVPIVTVDVAAVIDKMAPGAIQRFPVDVDGRQGKWEVLNVVRVVDAIDRERSLYGVWKPEDNRPDKVGAFRGVERVVIRSDIRQDAGIFRPAGWTVALIVSASLKKELEKIGGLGVRFRPLEGGFSAN